jgi:beta-phosphoglucomutase-like phosphatase (HAD superfamily)
VQWAIARSGRIAFARPSLDALEVPSNVPIITPDQVERAKPDPDLFLAAAAKLGLDIADSIVVGDSVWDLLAARRARALEFYLEAMGRMNSSAPVLIASTRILTIF